VVADSVREVIGRCTITAEDRPDRALSVSIGVVSIDEHTGGQDAVLAEADRSMYADKGRDR
jgi:GGDEF domain-containing protein